MPSDTPWSGLEAGAIDTRRVDATAKWGWFWAVMPRADIALVLQLSSLPKPLPDLPKLKSLEVRFQTMPGGPILYIRLKEESQRELFETLCRDVIRAGEQGVTEAEAVERAIGRTFRWHYLLRGGKLDLLSEDEQKGLIGEIEVLSMLMEAIGPKSAIAAWTGPSGAPKDFEMKADCFEVKARRGASQPFVKISNEFQLADVPDRRLWLAVIAVDKVQQPHGMTLSDVVSAVKVELEATDPALIQDFDLRLSDAGFNSLDDYSPWRWIVSKPDLHRVNSDFPRIDAPVPLGVSGVTYSIALSACQPFTVQWETVRSLLKDVDA